MAIRLLYTKSIKWDESVVKNMTNAQAIAAGKTFLGVELGSTRIKAVLLCLKYPGIKCMIIRKTYPELQENHIIPLCEMLHTSAENKEERIANYNDSKKHIKGVRIGFQQ